MFLCGAQETQSIEQQQQQASSSSSQAAAEEASSSGTSSSGAESSSSSSSGTESSSSGAGFGGFKQQFDSFKSRLGGSSSSSEQQEQLPLGQRAHQLWDTVRREVADAVLPRSERYSLTRAYEGPTYQVRSAAVCALGLCAACARLVVRVARVPVHKQVPAVGKRDCISHDRRREMCASGQQWRCS